MVNTEIRCQFSDCDHTVIHASEAVALAMFNTHVMTHNQPAAAISNAQKLPPIPRPEIRQDMSEEDWCSFVVEWNNFKKCTGIKNDAYADQLFQCCERNLMKVLIRGQPNIVEEGETKLLEAIKNLAVIKIATSAQRTKLLSSKQAHGESF